MATKPVPAKPSKEKILEGIIRKLVKEVRSELKEEPNPYDTPGTIFTVYRKASNSSYEIAKYKSKKTADSVVSILTRASKDEVGYERIKPTFYVKEEEF